MNILNIIKGHFKEIINSDQKISKHRMEICEKCPLFKKESYGLICNNKLWINPKTNNTSDTFKPGFLKGCGCRLRAKTTLKEESCPAGKW